MKPDEVIDLAEQAALFLRRLVDDGVPMEAAVQLTASFISSHIIDRMPEDEPLPKRPWDEA